MNYIKICLAAACILRLCGPFSVALAGSVTQPGSTLGTAPGVPLPGVRAGMDSREIGDRAGYPQGRVMQVRTTLRYIGRSWS